MRHTSDARALGGRERAKPAHSPRQPHPEGVATARP